VAALPENLSGPRPGPRRPARAADGAVPSQGRPGRGRRAAGPARLLPRAGRGRAPRCGACPVL